MGRTKLFLSVKLFPYVYKSDIFKRFSCGSSKVSDTTERLKTENENSCSRTVSLDGSKSGVVLGIYQKGSEFEMTPATAEFDQEHNGIISKHLNDVKCILKLGKAVPVTDSVIGQFNAIAIASLGPKNPGYNVLEHLDETRENVRVGVGAGVSLLTGLGCHNISVDDAGVPDAAAEAARLAAWRFKDGVEDGSHTKLSPYKAEDVRSWEAGAVLGRCQNWARYLSDMPPNLMTPVDFAQNALNVLCPLGVEVIAHDRHWIKAQGMEAFLAVAHGSCQEPIMLQLDYRVDERAPVLLTAKGTTFDCGGLCLKQPSQMTDSRACMAGAAVVVAAIRALAEMKIPVNVSAMIPLCENMISGQCMKVGDVVKTLNGLSVEIEDTDLEGRLMMADALVYGQALYKPPLVIDVATFTHGIKLATGEGAFGAFSNSENAWRALRWSGARTGDRPWLFPLWNFYEKRITNDPAVDLRNKGCGKASPCNGAAFLRKFVCCDWLHMDVTGVAKLAHATPPYLAPGRMTGRPTRTLTDFLVHMGHDDERKEHVPAK